MKTYTYPTYQKEWRTARRIIGKCVACPNDARPDKAHCEKCAERYRQNRKQRSEFLRNKVIEGYGGCCACCGETTKEFLAVDHKEIRARDEIREYGRKRSLTELCLIILKENFPSTYQLLCHNCNQSLGIYGYCPHRPEIRRPFGKG